MKKPSLIDKLAAMADPKRNDNEHERAVAAAKLKALRGRAQSSSSRGVWPPGLKLTAAAYARRYGLDPRKFRKALRAAGKHAPYTLEDLEGISDGHTG